jgi:hypothetical protein
MLTFMKCTDDAKFVSSASNLENVMILASTGARQDLMCCRDVYGVTLFVHKCMKIADAAAVAAARQQPR